MKRISVTVAARRVTKIVTKNKISSRALLRDFCFMTAADLSAAVFVIM